MKEIDFTIRDPLIKLYNEIEELERLDTASTLSSPEQLINIVIQIIKKTNDYKDGFNDWYELPVAVHTLIVHQDVNSLTKHTSQIW